MSSCVNDVKIFQETAPGRICKIFELIHHLLTRLDVASLDLSLHKNIQGPQISHLALTFLLLEFLQQTSHPRSISACGLSCTRSQTFWVVRVFFAVSHMFSYEHGPMDLIIPSVYFSCVVSSAHI